MTSLSLDDLVVPSSGGPSQSGSQPANQRGGQTVSWSGNSLRIRLDKQTDRAGARLLVFVCSSIVPPLPIMSSFNSFGSFAPGSSLALPSTSSAPNGSAGPSNASGLSLPGSTSFAPSNGSFALPPLPAPAQASTSSASDKGKDIAVDGSNAAGETAVAGTSGAVPANIPSHGIVPTLQ